MSSEDLKDQFIELLEKAKRDKRAFKKLKELSVDTQHFLLATELRAIERDLFPESEEVKEAKVRASKLNLLFRMIELSVSDHTAWMIEQAIIFDIKNPGQFSLRDAESLMDKTKRIFDKD